MLRIRRRWAIPLTVAIFSAAAFGLSLSILISNTRQAELMAGRELQAIAIAASDRLSPAGYHRLFFSGTGLKPRFNEAVKQPEFAEISRTLKSVTLSYGYLNLTQENIYTFVRNPDNDTRLLWGVMLHPQPFTGESYSPPAALIRVVNSGKPGFSGVYLSSASHREWISGYAPIIYDQKVLGVVEVAREISQVLATARETTLPAIFISIGVFLISVGAIVIILQFARRMEKANIKLTAALNKLTESTAVSSHLTESSSDIIFGLDAEMKIISINHAIRWQLGIEPEQAIGTDVATAFFDNPEIADKKTDATLINPEFVRQTLQQLRSSGKRISFTTALRTTLTGDIRDYRITVEKIPDAGELKYLGRAVSLGEMMIATMLDRCRLKFNLNNSLILSEEMATHLAGLCRRFLGEQKISTYRIMLREMLLNAIEHGNLEIDFNQKTEALGSDTYFELIERRRNQEPYRNRLVLVHCAIDRAKIAFRITDEGNGFDHQNMIAGLRAENNERPHGRGILMTLQEFDLVKYNARGNSVLLIKYLE